MKPWLRLTLITMTVGGGFSGFVVTFVYLLHPESQSPGYYYFLFTALFMILYAFVTISGLIFVQDSRRTVPLRLALWLQVPWISSPLITYQFTAGFHFTITLIEGNLNTEFLLGFYWQFNLIQDAPWGFGVNLFAVLMLILLTRSLKRQDKSLPLMTAVSESSQSFVEEIDQILQRRLAQANVHDQSVHLHSQLDGNVTIAVNRVYQDVNAIKETAIRDIVQESISEWQDNK